MVEIVDGREDMQCARFFETGKRVLPRSGIGYPLHRAVKRMSRLSALTLAALASLLSSAAFANEFLPVPQERHATPADDVTLADVSFAEMPAWVEPEPAFEADRRLDNLQDPREPSGFHSQLVDSQYNVVNPFAPESFFAIEYEVINRYGVENYSSFEIEFEPSHERLRLHEILVERNGELIDKRDDARLDILRRENETDELTYNGYRTLAVLLRDVRVGDRIRYSYSVTGGNPAFEGRFEIGLHTDSEVPRAEMSTRVLSAVGEPLLVRQSGDHVPLVQESRDGVLVSSYALRQVAAPGSEADAPPELALRDGIVFSNVDGWDEVVNWVLPFYTLPATPNDELLAVAARIAAEHESRAARIGAALHWVQDEVRYFGVQLGEDSFRPASVETTLERRFGDCKAKAVLLMALLDALGIESQAALVDTSRELLAPEQPFRLRAFDHVIVHLEHEGRSHFIDPTRSYQRGPLGSFSEPDFGKALLIAAGSRELVPMAGDREGGYRLVEKTVEFPSDAQASARLDVVTTLTGSEAESLRYNLEYDGQRQTARDYLEYYEDWFGDLERVGDTRFTETDAPSLVVREQYRIAALWEEDDHPERYLWVYADEIIGQTPELPDASKDEGRRHPVMLHHPTRLVERWLVKLPAARHLDDLDGRFDTPWFHFEKHHELSADGRELTVHMEYRARADRVMAEDLPAFRKALDEVIDMASFYIEDRPPETQDMGSVSGWLGNLVRRLAAGR